MGRPSGYPKTGGRTKGTPNRRGGEFGEALSSAGIDPVKELGRILESDRLGTEDRASILLALLPYLYPKRKAIELDSKPEPNGGDVEYIAVWGGQSTG